MNKKNTLYQIIREHLFEEQFLEISKSYDRIEEVENYIDWALARRPHRFPKISKHLYLWKTQKFSNHFPQLRIAYNIEQDEHKVYLVEVEEIKNDN